VSLSATFSVEASTTVQRHSVAYGSTVDFAIQSLTGIETIEWSIVGTSKSTQAALVITPAGSPSGATASCVMPADPGDGLGRAFAVKLRVSNQIESAVAYRIFGAVNAAGIVPLVVGEELWGNATHGWTDIFNQALNTIYGGAGGSNTQLQYNNGGALDGASGITVVGSETALAFATGYVQFGTTPATSGLARIPNNPGRVIGYRAFDGTDRSMLYLAGNGSTFDDLQVGDADGTSGNSSLYLNAKSQSVFVVAGTTRCVVNTVAVLMPQGIGLFGARQGGGSDIFIANVASDNANYFGATDSAATYLRSGAGIGFRLDGTTDGFSMASALGLWKSNVADASATLFALRGAGSTASNNSGGKLRLDGGRRAGSGNYGAVSLRLNQDDSTLFNMLEATHLANLRRILALCRTADLTTTEMPTNTGDLVTYIGNAAAVPSASAVGGGILYAEAGALKWRGSGGTVTTMGPA